MSIETLTAPQAAGRLAAPEAPILLDVRTGAELALARIEGALHIPMDTLPGRVGELDPARPTIVICHHGLRSMQVARWLAHQGFEAVANLTGGIEAWSRLVDPTVRRY